jgi:PAS domain-containing protein
MQRRAVFTGRQYGATSAPNAALAEADDDLSALLGAGQFLEAVIEHIPAVVFVKDARDFRFILLNRAGEEFLASPAKPSSARPITTSSPRRRPINSSRATSKC